MRLVLIADCFPPLRTSGAVQIRDLTRALVGQGHEVTVLLPGTDQPEAWRQEEVDGACILRLKTPPTKDISYFRRTLAELIMPYAMARNFARSPLAQRRFDGVIWYSPSIFFAPLVRRLKRRSGCQSYLILRDIFPDWAADLGLLRRQSLPFRALSAVARAQYRAADVIGVQARGNLAWLRDLPPRTRAEVLQNWLGEAASAPAPARMDLSPLAGRKIFLYAGNMGVAQGLDVVIDLARALQHREDVGFLFVGRGSEVAQLRRLAGGLPNVLFHGETDPDEIPGLCARCSAGLVVLDPRHRTHNIPGKFLAYMQSGLPVLACVNPGNDLATIIRSERVGQVVEHRDLAALQRRAGELLEEILRDPELPNRCRALSRRDHTAHRAAEQISQALAVGQPKRK
ncbi:glycosyltransferase family 4 protein [Falsigemmobacter faecalis]|uniref:Glycosyltransferase WbuB n=1 Tax=Falsigemmobacter faecalis TaxID=2488730 RepID=A0A3P3DGL0_9RHOB|nr:glycosyltransferase family 4 protein [Falsigemmobacter faecalis]RRH72974.1 glycosyltransferase WbuB [Falsigemmobacter faecalis]